MKKYLILTFLVGVFGVTSVLGQFTDIIDGDGDTREGPSVRISGDNTAPAGETKTYILSVSGSFFYDGSWSVTGGTIISQDNNLVTVRWSSNPGTVRYFGTYTSGGRLESGRISESFSVTVSVPLPPATPSIPIISSNCGSAVITRAIPPSGVTWYWQDIATGTSTSNSAPSVTRTSGTTYYLRARDNSSGLWSAARTISYLILLPQTWYRDQDGDGLGDPATTLTECNQPVGYVSNANDSCPLLDGQGTDDGCPVTAGLTATENYVHTLTPQVEVSNTANLTAAQKIESVTYYDGLGRPKQSIAIRGGGVVQNNTITYDWSLGESGTSFFARNGAVAENRIINGVTPFGDQDLIWECIPNGDNHADGGWNTRYFSIDASKGYRFSVWVKRTGGMDGTTYHGTTNVNFLWGEENNNPYFWYGDLPILDTWYLMVGVVHPVGYTGGDTGVSGVYDTQGNKVSNGRDFVWREGATTTRLRNYLFYSTSTDVRQYFWNPVVQKLDGSELSLSALKNYAKLITPTAIPSDLVTHIEYDELGRKSKDYLPYASQAVSGQYKTDAKAQTHQFYANKYAKDFAGITDPMAINPYAEKVLENSPLNRVFEQTAPGKKWQKGTEKVAGKDYFNGHSIKFEYQANAESEVRLYHVNTSYNETQKLYVPSLSSDGFYNPAELYKNVTKDENWVVSDGNNHTTEEFTNKQGQVVLKRTYNNNQPHDTYYVYDDFGNLTYVLPPKVDTSNGVDSAELSELCYQYKYDHRNRLVEKKIPGKGWEYIVYDKLDRPVLTQDANLRAANQWLFTKYDVFGRVVYTGSHTNTTYTTRGAMQEAFNQTNAQPAQLYESRSSTVTLVNYYTHANFPNQNTEIFTVNYYDSYEDLPSGLTPPTSVYEQAVTTKVKGLTTVTKTRVLATNHWITTVTYYDKKARPIYVYTENPYLETIDIVASKLDFTSKVLETTTTHKKTGKADLVTVDSYDYDHMGRLLNHKQRINGATHQEVIAANNYDNLGQLVRKDVGGKTNQRRLQEVVYNYNVRGWLTGINKVADLGGDLFGFAINYNNSTSGSGDLYNGNIAQTFWKTANDNTLRGYSYGYDHLNRITSAVGSSSSNYNVSGIGYDKNGNINTLIRNGQVNTAATAFGVMDNLAYNYDSGNKLLSVTDTGNLTFGFKDGNTTGNDYSYDANGNLLSDANKNITNIEYNHLNLPTEITFTPPLGLYGGSRKIGYTYDAAGTKLAKSVVTITNTGVGPTGGTTTTYYAGNYIYEKYVGQGPDIVIGQGQHVLQFFNHPEGYVKYDNQGFSYVYQYKDQVNNVRLSYSDLDGNGAIDPSTEILHERNYYPFGLEHKGYNNTIIGRKNNYKTYQGQEKEEELGKNTYAFQWRDYDPAIARFNKVDRFAEKYYQENPYHFTGNNPIVFREIAGDSITLARVVVHDKINNTNHQQTITNDLQTATGLTLTVDPNTGVLGYAKDADGNAIISTTTDTDGNTVQNGSASARADLIGLIDSKGVIDVGIDANRSTTNRESNSITLGESQIGNFISGTPSELNSNTLGFGMTLLHEFQHTNIGGGNRDPRDRTSTTSTGPVVDRVNVYRQELDNNPSRTGAPYGQRRQYYATPNSSGTGGSIRFKYQTTNRRGRTVNRTATIRY